MEDNKTGSTSDRDKKMMGSFESYADKKNREEKEKAEKDKKRLRSLPGLFEQISKEDEEKEEQKDKPRDVTESIFRTEPEVEEEEEAEETRLPEVQEEESLGEETLDEKEGSVEELTEEETQAAIEQYIEARQEEEVEPAEQVLHDNIKETGSVEDGYEAALDELGLDEAELDDETEESSPEEAESEEPTPDDEPEEEEEDDPAATSAASTSATSTVPPPPPIPPAPSLQSQNQYYANQPPIVNNPFDTFNAQPAPNPASANRLNDRFDRGSERKYQRGADMLVGGIVGYLLGRRRGRIKTEAELIPIQQKLEKQVSQLYEDISEKESKIRRLAALHAEKQPEESVLQRRLEDDDQQEAMTRRSFESINRADYQKASPERLGRFVVPPVELAAEKAPEVASMNLQQLLEVAANIKRDNISLRQMFENGRLDAVGLRRVVREYLQGDHFERVLSENLKTPEQHELDPLAKAMQAGAASGIATSSGYDLGSGLPPVQPLQPLDQQPKAQHTYYYPAADQRRQAVTAGIVAGLVVAVVVLILFALLT